MRVIHNSLSFSHENANILALLTLTIFYEQASYKVTIDDCNVRGMGSI